VDGGRAETPPDKAVDPPPGVFELISPPVGTRTTFENLGMPLRVSLSQRIDPKSVTKDSFVVTRDLGDARPNYVVEGDAASPTVDGTGISFTPKEGWRHSMRYKATLRTAITDVRGAHLKEASFAFDMRTASWSACSNIARTDPGESFSTPRIAVSPSGKVAVTWTVHLGNNVSTRTIYLNHDGIWSGRRDIPKAAIGIAALHRGTSFSALPKVSSAGPRIATQNLCRAPPAWTSIAVSSRRRALECWCCNSERTSLP
jgi:hypothetical protein